MLNIYLFEIEIDHLMNSLVNAQVFNDERDLILAKWNQLQAFYGIGKIFYQNMSIDVTKDNRLTRFKTIGYSCKPLYKNEDGLVCLIINQKDTQVRTNQKNVTDTLFKIFNSDQSLLIKVEAIKQIADDKTELAFYVEQRLSPVNESLKSRVPAMQVFQHLNKQEGVAASTTTSSFNLGGGLGTSNVANSLSTKQTIKQQLEQIGVTSFYPLMGLSDEQIKGYLDKPPAGFDHALWDQGKKKNPNPKKLLPVQIIGFQGNNFNFFFIFFFLLIKKFLKK
jgi:nuclear pore complex protein Nup54